MTSSNAQQVEEESSAAEGRIGDSPTQADTQSNSDLYAPPAYTILTPTDEESLNAETFATEKAPLLEQHHSTVGQAQPSSSYTPEAPAPREQEPPSHDSPQVVLARKPIDWTINNADAVRCSVLADRPATWVVKKKRGMALCPLAAAVLLHEGILNPKQLQLVPSLLDRPSTSRYDLHEPTDPLSAFFISSYDVIGDMLLGAAGGPVEVGRKLGPQGHESQRNEALARQSQASTWERETESSSDGALMLGPKALVHYGVGTYKGCRKIVETVIKTPMTYTHSMTRGFHNTPKLYGERLRPREEVTDLKSGLKVGGKTLVVGTYDMIKDLIVVPVRSTQKEGLVGLGKGVCKGFGNSLCNFGEATFGIIGYPSYGVYKEIQKSASGGNLPARNMILTLGEAEYEQANDEERLSVVKRWLQAQMRQT